MRFIPIIKINLICLLMFLSLNTYANKAEYHLSLKNHLFYPDKIVIQKNQKIKLVIFNHDNNIEEFDSFDLNREKVIFPNQKATVFIGPLPVGEYSFFGEYHPHSAKGTVLVVDDSNVKKDIREHDAN